MMPTMTERFDLQRRYDEQYDIIEKLKFRLPECGGQMLRSIQQEKILAINIYRLLLAFDEVHHSATEAEQKRVYESPLLSEFEMFPEKRKRR